MYTASTSDAILWEGIKQDDSKAFACLYDRYWRRIFTTAFSHVKDREVCSEIVHDIFLNIWLKRDDLDIESFEKYLKAAARYHVYKHQRAQKRKPITYTADVEEQSRGMHVNRGEEGLHEADLEKKMNQILATLPQRCREIFLMSREEQLSNEEIASRLGISKRTVENQITYALKQLREALRDVSAMAILLWYVGH